MTRRGFLKRAGFVGGAIATGLAVAKAANNGNAKKIEPHASPKTPGLVKPDCVAFYENGHLIHRATFAPIQMQDGDSLQIRWDVTMKDVTL